MTDPRRDDPLAEARRLKRQADLLWWDMLLAWGAVVFVVAMVAAALAGAGSP